VVLLVRLRLAGGRRRRVGHRWSPRRRGRAPEGKGERARARVGRLGFARPGGAGRGRERGRARVRAASARDWAAAVCWAERGRREREAVCPTVFVFLFQKCK
jgi:hypothetical protein